MEKIGVVLLAHGARNKQVKDDFLNLGQRLKARLPEQVEVKGAFFSLTNPSLEEQVEKLVQAGVEAIYVYPYFLSAGKHVSKDLPELIGHLQRIYPKVRFNLLEILGKEPLLEELVFEQIQTALSFAYPHLPEQIEQASFDFIQNFVQDEQRRDIITRVVHATCDFSFLSGLCFHPHAIDTGLALLKNKRPIFCDVKMVQAGLTGLENVHCLIDQPEIADKAKLEKTTRAVAGLRSFGRKLDGSMVVIGNAPTALQEVIRLAQEERIKPALVVGVPVGFVGAAASKRMLMQSDLVYIANRGPRGGSSVAVAIVNALKKKLVS